MLQMMPSQTETMSHNTNSSHPQVSEGDTSVPVTATASSSSPDASRGGTLMSSSAPRVITIPARPSSAPSKKDLISHPKGVQAHTSSNEVNTQTASRRQQLSNPHSSHSGTVTGAPSLSSTLSAQMPMQFAPRPPSGPSRASDTVVRSTDDVPTYKELSYMIQEIYSRGKQPQGLSKDEMLLQRERAYLQQEGISPVQDETKLALLLNPEHESELMHFITRLRASGESPESAMLGLRDGMRRFFGSHRVFAHRKGNMRFMLLIGEKPFCFSMGFYEEPGGERFEQNEWKCFIPEDGLIQNISLDQLTDGNVSIGIVSERATHRILKHDNFQYFCNKECIGIYPLVNGYPVDRDKLLHALRRNRNRPYFQISKHLKKAHFDPETMGVFIILYYSHDNPDGRKELVECSPPMVYDEETKNHLVKISIPKNEKRLWSFQVLFIDRRGYWKQSQCYTVLKRDQYVRMMYDLMSEL